MDKKAIMNMSLLIAVILLIVLVICWINSFSLALSFAGLNNADVFEITALADRDGMVHKFIQTTTKEGNYVLAQAKRNAFGIWSVEQINTASTEESENSILYMVWAKRAGAQRFNAQNANLALEIHVFYFGNDAIKFITIDDEQLPDNTTINIQQAGERYWLHIISFPDEDGHVDLIGSIEYPIRKILEESGCIEPLK